MAIFNSESKLSDVIFSNPQVLTVVNRFGLYLGFSDLTIGEACVRHDIDLTFFLAIVNTYLNDDYFPEAALKTINVNHIADYLRLTDSYYLELQVPNIERHFGSLISRSDGESNNLGLLRNFFFEMKKELEARTELDEKLLFPALLSHRILSREEVEALIASDEAVEDKVSDLATFFVIHLQGDYDRNLCMAVVNAIFMLSNDIRQNNRIRRRILLPKVAGDYADSL